MNHKRRKPKSARASCLMCKPNKMGGWSSKKLGNFGFGKIRREVCAAADLRADAESNS